MWLTWIWASFILSMLCSNEILMKMLFKSKVIIHSFDHLNEISDFTAITYEQAYFRIGIYVSYLFITIY